MFQFLKSKSSKSTDTEPKSSWASRLKGGLKRTRQKFSENVSNLFLGKKAIDDTLFEELETLLLSADVGVDATQTILEELTQRVKRKQLDDAAALLPVLKEVLINLLSPCEQPLNIDKKPFVLLMVGVNGAGKTTSIAKLANYYKQAGNKVMLAAGDTFRAAAVEQLQVWGERNDVSVIAQQSGADSASVIFDAMQAATAKNIDLLIADTAGRLHTQEHLMAELQKIKRVIGKQNDTAPHEVMLVIDAGMGQNALRQAEEFNEAVGLTGITITKLDGTARGGIIFAIAEKMRLPIRFIGIGEEIDDLKPFCAKEYVDALFEKSTKETTE
ncbi:MAG: signal recognition particle-docking protein FtsY [Coxiellaceae bacterium]|nr:signal recognition particle-docking protein FtsY [Coxiellaceae bacterium]